MAKHKFDITAFIYDRRGRIISIGKNSYVKTHPLQAQCAHATGLDHKLFLHAEVHAIARCKDISKAHKIVVMRFNKAGEPALAKPCPACHYAITELTPIKVIEYTGKTTGVVEHIGDK